MISKIMLKMVKQEKENNLVRGKGKKDTSLTKRERQRRWILGLPGGSID
jgi:hypothetical protein